MFVQVRRDNLSFPPEEKKILRPSGYSLSLQLDTLIDSMLFRVMLAAATSLLAAYPAHVLAVLIGGNGPTLWIGAFTLLFLVFLIPCLVFTIGAFQQFLKARNVRLGLRGEQAVAGVLHELGDAGYRAFHDLQPDGSWNIDHVLAGPRGVFLIETKARRRYPSRKKQPNHHVIYDGATLQYPSGKDLEAVPQVTRNTHWLENYLSERNGSPIKVQSIIVIPGWFIDCKGNYPVKVMNTTYLRNHLRSQDQKLSEEQVSRIIKALDDQCRTLEF